jgi:hypothetical protein
MIKGIPRLSALLGCLLLICGCATIITGTSQKVDIATEPKGADIKVYNAEGNVVASGTSPCEVSLAKGDGFFKAANYKVAITSPGHPEKDIQLQGQMEIGWYVVGNFFLGGILGWLIIDPASGAMWTLSPSSVDEKLADVQRPGALSLKIVLRNDISDAALAQARYLGTIN